MASLAVGYRALRWLRRRREEIAGRHVLITGGSEGIGLELAKICVQRGAKVTLLARSVAKLTAAKAELLSLAPVASVSFVSADVADDAAVVAAVVAAEKEHGAIDICIAAAGVSVPKYFEDLTTADFDLMLRVNYLGVVNVSRSVLKGMVKRDSGHFCAVCSIAAAVPFIGYAGYSPSKAACRSFIDVLRNEFSDTNIRFHLAFPPDTDTPGYAKENATKPYETSHLWPECFNEVFPAAKVAEMMIDGILDGDYFVRCPDTFGNMLVSRAWGHFPRSWPWLEALVLAPLFVGLHQGMVWLADRAVRARKHHKQASEEKDGARGAASSGSAPA